MSKAEERALEAYPKETRDITGFVVDIGHPQYMRDIYIEGYQQAEKDLELSWEDIKLIWNITDEMVNMPEEEFYKEVLKRFKERKGGMYKTWNSLRGNLKEDNQGNIVGGLKL